MTLTVLICIGFAFYAGVFVGDYLSRGKRELFDQPDSNLTDQNSVISRGE
jgi:hypothetical protein